MQDTYKTMLMSLSDNDKQFEEEIRERSNGKRSRSKARELRNFILVLPDMIRQIRVWLDAAAIPAEVRNLHGFMLTYLYHPLDFVRDDSYGLLGYLDDAYLVGSVYLRIAAHLSSTDVHHRPKTDGLSRQLGSWLFLTAQIIPTECRKIDRMLEDLAVSDATSFQQMMGRSAKS